MNLKYSEIRHIHFECYQKISKNLLGTQFVLELLIKSTFYPKKWIFDQNFDF